jgi:hypothetical protein
MSAETAALPRTDDDGSRTAAPVSGTWNLDLERCALEVNYSMLGATVWRARLRPLEARIVLADRDEDGAAVAGGLVRISAGIAARAVYTSLPGTSGWFLPGTPCSEQITVTGNAFPHDDAAGQTVYTLARVSAGDRLWRTRLTIRFALVHDERAVVAVAGTIVRGKDARVPRTAVRVEMAAEFVRCG